MSSINPKKLKVLELRRELEQRNISVTKSMKKADLTALLMSAIESEVGQEKDFSSSEAMDDSATSGAEGDSQIDQTQSDQAAEHSDLETAEEAVPDQEICKSPSSITPNIETAVDDKESVLAEKPENEEKNEEIFKEDVQMKSSSQVASSESTIVKVEDVSMTSQERQSEVKVPVVEESSGDVVVTEEKSEVKIESADHQSVEDEARETIPDGSEQNIKKDAEETEETSEVKIESTDHQSIEDEAKETIPDDGERNIKREGKGHHQDPSRKRKHTEKSDRHNISDIGYTPPEEEPDEEFDDSLVVLDTYNSDLNFKVSRDRLSGQPLTMEGFAYLWGGARATYGIKSGKACFECKILEEDAVKHLPSDEPHPHVVRVGWSTDYSSLQLGEDAFSYGYGGTGKFSADCKFSDFGETFKEGDVIGCYIDFSQENQVQLAFTKNGEFQGVAFTEEKDKLQNQSLFPHVLCKNTGIELNFGLRETAHFPHPEELQDYIFISSVPSSERERAVKGPQSKKECEVLMMCGLPGAGKTHYCQQIMKEEPDKKYNVLGTNSIMMKMRVMGIARKKNYASRWEQLIDNATQCLSRLLQVACRKRRNYILDQTNVYASAQRRKMRPFEGFQRKAIVIVPTEEEYKMRFEKRTDDEGKEVPEMAILGMKANFILPEEGNIFDEIIFTELSREEAQKLVEKYREEGKKHGPPPEKRFRAGGENRNRNRDPGWRRGRGFRGPMPYSNDAPWGRFGGGQIGFARGGFASAGFNRGGGFRGRPSGFGARGKDFGRGGRRDNSSRKTERGGSKGKGGWQDHGGRGNRGGYGGYNRQNQGRGGFRNSGSGNSFQGRQNQPNPGNRMSQSAQSVAPQSAQSYTYGHHPQYNTSPSVTAYNSGGYNNQQQKPQAVIPVAQHGQAQQGYQQAYGQQAGQQAGQQDYSQQWAQFYQQQAQAQQYQNYYANYQQQYYNQQSAQQQRP